MTNSEWGVYAKAFTEELHELLTRMGLHPDRIIVYARCAHAYQAVQGQRYMRGHAS